MSRVDDGLANISKVDVWDASQLEGGWVGQRFSAGLPRYVFPPSCPLFFRLLIR